VGWIRSGVRVSASFSSSNFRFNAVATLHHSTGRGLTHEGFSLGVSSGGGGMSPGVTSRNSCMPTSPGEPVFVAM